MLRYLLQLAGESLVYGLSGIISRFLGIFLVPIYTRLFTPEDYGVMSLVATTMAIVSIFVVLALDNSAARWYWDTEDAADRKRTLASWAWCQFAVASLFALAIYVLADWLGRVIVGNEETSLYFRIMAITLPLSVPAAILINWLRMQRRPWDTMRFGLATSLISIVLSVVLVVGFRLGLFGVYLAQLITVVIGAVIAVWFLRDWLSPWHFNWERLRDMLGYALPLIPAGLAFWVVGFSDRYFVQFYTNTSEVGLYQVGSSIAAFVALATGAFQQAWGPFALSIHKEEHAVHVYAHSLLAYVWLTSVISTALALFAPEAIALFATDEYLGASSVVGFLAFSYVMGGLVYIAATGPTVVKTTGPVGIAVMLAAVANVLLNLALVPTFGKTGSAFATLVSQAAVPLFIFYRAQQLYPIPYRFTPAVAILLFGLITTWLGGRLAFTNQWVEIASKVALLAVFFPALFLLRVVTPAQIRRFLPA